MDKKTIQFLMVCVGLVVVIWIIAPIYDDGPCPRIAHNPEHARVHAVVFDGAIMCDDGNFEFSGPVYDACFDVYRAHYPKHFIDWGEVR